MKHEMNTPFGVFTVKQNGKIIDFKCNNKVYFPSKAEESIRLYIIEIDTIDMECGDILTYGFEKIPNITTAKTEKAVFLEDGSLILGLSKVEDAQYNEQNNQLSFELKEKKTVSIILCCIEKTKVKNTKKIMQDIFEHNTVKIEESYQIIKKRKPKKVMITILLFIIFLSIYISFTHLLFKYNVIYLPNWEKFASALIGISFVSYALSHLGTIETKVQKHTKKTFVISLLLLVFLFLVFGTISFLLLNYLKKIKDTIWFIIGVSIIFLVFICWFTLEYKIDAPKKAAISEKKKEKINPYLLELSNSFPKSLKANWLTLASKLEQKQTGILTSEQNFKYQLNGENVIIPYRIFLEEATGDFSEIEQQLLYALYTRNANGYIREKYIKKILEMELSDWQLPFIICSSEDYVIEIISQIYDHLKEKNNDIIKQFLKNNKEVLCKHYQKMINVWNIYYKKTSPNFHQYVGRKLFRECFNYSRKLEPKRFQCACCENFTIKGYTINYYNNPCPVCYWQNNIEQNNNPMLVSKENDISLVEAQKNYKLIGAINEDSLSKTRAVLETEKKHINTEQILKLLKLQFLKIGGMRKKDPIHPFYEYQKQYFKISFQSDTNEFLLEQTDTIERARNHEWKEWKRFNGDCEKDKLVRDVLNAIKRKTKPSKAKKLTKSEKLEIIKEEINRWDPVGLIKKGASPDEYNIEIKKIVNRINKIETVEELNEAIEQIFQKMFGENLFIEDKKEIAKVAKKIFKKIKS